MTKNKPIYLVRISKQMEGPSVINWFIFGHGVIIHFIMHRKPTNFAKKLTRCEEICFPPFCLFSQQLSNLSTDSLKFATIAVDVDDNLNFSCPLFHLRNVA